jgi:hypothetical protein
VIGYAPEDDSKLTYADEIRKYLLDPASRTMVQGEARGSKGNWWPVVAPSPGST